MVKRLILPDAQTFPGDQLTKKGNDRHSGYIQWADFWKTAEIYELFFDKKRD